MQHKPLLVCSVNQIFCNEQLCRQLADVDEDGDEKDVPGPSPEKRGKETVPGENEADTNKKSTRARKDRLAKVTNDRTVFVGNLSLKTSEKVKG